MNVRMWIVTGNDREHTKLVSSNKIDRLLPVGSYLTVLDETDVKHILIVEESYQKSMFEPSPLIVDAGLPVLKQDQTCKNLITAKEIKQFPLLQDGMFSYLKPNQTANRTTQEEMNELFPSKEGYPLFLATNFMGQNSLLREDTRNLIYVKIPYDSLYLQTMICGQTGSGKTVAMKYLIEQFLKHEQGAVLAINVKSIDLLTMDQPTTFTDENLEKKTKEEWARLELDEQQLENYRILIPRSEQRVSDQVSRDKVRHITLRTEDLEPNALLGVLQNVTDRAAEALPNIFRYWKDVDKSDLKTFRNFIVWFGKKVENGRMFPTMSQIGEESEIPLHPGTCNSIKRSLENASSYFDNMEDCIAISEEHVMIKGRCSVIDLSSRDTTAFGAILLRHLLSKIYESKAVGGYYADIPVLIVIDEVHQFYRSTASAKALEELNAIARMGRSEKIGVIFASQNPADLPDGLTAIVNTRIFFRSLGTVSRKFGISDASVDLSSLDNGFSLISNISLPQIRLVKFPIPCMGVRT